MGSVPDHAQPSAEFTNAPVPADKQINWWAIALIKIGVVLALPGFLIGAQIGHGMGLRNGAIAFFGGAAILAIIAMLTGTVAARTHLATSVIIQFSFGQIGARIVNFILGATLAGWFAVTAEIFGSSLAQMATSVAMIQVPEQIATAIGGVLMVGTTMFGFKAISRLADLAVPLLLILLLVVTWLAIKNHSLTTLLAYRGTGDTSIGIGISAVVGGASVGTIIFPDIARFARSANHGRVAAIVTYGLCLPSMFVMVAVASVATGERNIMMLMLALGLGGITLAFLIFKAWTTNVGNLYSSSLFFSALLPTLSFRFVVLGAGTLGTVGAILGVTEHFVPFLLILGIAIPPIAGIYVTDYQLRGRSLDLAMLEGRPKIGVPAFCAWGAGVAIAALSSKGIMTLTSIPSCDSIIVAAGLYAALNRLAREGDRLTA